ncbi:MAG: hypothetical protein ACJ0Q2_04385 [Candidatus Azotimanducaceae bacterium]
MIRALPVCLLALVFSTSFGQEGSAETELDGLKEGHGILDRFTAPYDYFQSLFNQNAVPIGFGVAALCINKKVFGMPFRNRKLLTPPQESFLIKGNSKAGLSDQICSEKDYELLDYVMTLVPKNFRDRQKNHQMLKICLHKKVFYTGGGMQIPMQSILSGRAEEC